MGFSDIKKNEMSIGMDLLTSVVVLTCILLWRSLFKMFLKLNSRKRAEYTNEIQTWEIAKGFVFFSIQF